MMARARTASTHSRAATIQGMARSVAHPAYSKIIAAEPWLRKLVPVLVVIVVLILGTSAWLEIQTSELDAINALSIETELATALSRDEILKTIGERAPISIENPQAVLMTAIPSILAKSGRVIILTDTNGIMKAVIPSNAAVPNDIPNFDLLKFTHSPFGVVSTVIESLSGRTLVSVTRLPAPLGELAIYTPIDQNLSAWHKRSGSLLSMLCAALLTIAGLGAAYFWQAYRVRQSDVIVEKVLERLDLALNRGRCGLWDWDISRGTIYWSDSMYDMLGLKRQAEFLSFGDVNSRVHPDDRDLYAIADQLAAEQTNAVDHAFRILDAHQDWVWVRARAELVYDDATQSAHLVGIVVDITEQRRTAAERATADLRLHDAIETIGEAFVLWDADNRLVMCNSKFQDLHYLPQELTRRGTPYEALKPYLAHFIPNIRREQLDEGDSSAKSYEMLLPEGRWLQVNERRTKDGGYVSVGTDITALKTEEQRFLESERKLTATISDLRRSRVTLETQAEQLSRLAERYLEQKAEAESANRAKSEFLAKMSHELRTPLNAILGFAEIMDAEIYGALGHPKYKDYSHDISRSGQALLTIIADILDMAELEAGRIRINKHPLILNDVAQMTIDQMKEFAEAKSQKIIANLSAETPLLADQRAFERIISHLLSNAIKFTPEGGRITVTTREVSGAVNLYVEDNGIGIPKEALAKLGRPFEWVELDAKKPTEGAGLGLAIARSFTELHGGTLTIRSTEGSGTTVLVRLPIRLDAPLEQAA
ncbi:MAG: ATP-binding protein [Beijerinckiaceae bacterium]|nr:ATP-binding protein [Beijerinckiaceae bacterium]